MSRITHDPPEDACILRDLSAPESGMCASLQMHLFLSQRQSHLHNPLHIQVVSAGTLGLYERDSGPVTLSGSDQEKTLASLATINDHPFYAMRYHGDYGFARPVGLSVSQPTSSSDGFAPLRLPQLFSAGTWRDFFHSGHQSR
jgi:hypothetical protein